ncbi:MAG TPA: DUF3617 family protein [Sphingomicrobium sp.]|nr:DUF3617 family protein [Sphingomicrobium sp.]
MNIYFRLCIGRPAAVLVLAALTAAAGPSALSRVSGGLWQIDREGAAPAKLCIANPAALAQLEHRGAACKRAVVRDGAMETTIHYTCAGGGFGHSTITVLTPRSLRIQTQGIARDAPFNYTFQARRLGDCPAH